MVRASQVALGVKNLPTDAGEAREEGLIPGSGGFPWRRKWQPTPVFSPGKFHGQRSLAGYSPWGHKESDTTERLSEVWLKGFQPSPGTLVSSHGPEALFLCSGTIDTENLLQSSSHSSALAATSSGLCLTFLGGQLISTQLAWSWKLLEPAASHSLPAPIFTSAPWHHLSICRLPLLLPQLRSQAWVEAGTPVPH